MAPDQRIEDPRPSSAHAATIEESPLGAVDQAEDTDQSFANHSTDEEMAARGRDPNRPKRKKARRACSACQRAHLTCSDNRPCERCIKRNLAYKCHDGARKKAKYLGDVADSVLRSSHGTSFGASNIDLNQPNTYATTLSVAPTSSYRTFTPCASDPQMPPPAIDTKTMPITQAKQSPVSSLGSGHPSPIPQVAPTSNPLNTQRYPDPSGSNYYNFDLSSMNFGSQYGALEFDMLEQMTSNSDRNPMNPNPRMSNAVARYPQTGYDPSQFNDQRQQLSQDYPMDPKGPSAWATAPSSYPMQFTNSYDPSMEDAMRRVTPTAPHAFAIGAGNGFPNTTPPPTGEFLPPDSLAYTSNGSPPQQTFPPSNTSQHMQYPIQSQPLERPPSSSNISAPQQPRAKPHHARKPKPHSLSSTPSKRKTSKDAAEIYHNVKEPYPYTESFHRLFILLRRRFTKKKLVRIAKALASIRPSFISTTNSLVPEDLVFMEKYFQRSLLEYELFTLTVATPTIVCRRTGEVALSTKEFEILTGWSSDVLLGRDPNLNEIVKKRASDDTTTSGGLTSVSSRGNNTPLDPSTGAKPLPGAGTGSSAKKHQPVFLAELLDEDSVVRFYEDYSHLAFADSKGSVWSPCKVVKYLPPAVELRTGEGDSRRTSAEDSGDVKRAVKTEGSGISSEERMRELGREEGLVSCMHCWMVKRDAFNIPMMVVINFLPIM